MLYDFLTTHRAELIHHCTERVAKRYAPARPPQAVEHGVPLFLKQLVHTLEDEGLTTTRTESEPNPSPVDTDIGRAATLNGAELLRLGFTVDQVVHHYGDVCQAITESAVRNGSPINTDEFRTLNRCLDEAIADAVTSFVDETENATLGQATHLDDRMGALAEAQRRLIDTSLQTLAAIQSGQLAAKGATAAALVKTLEELRGLVDHTLPEIRLISGVTRPPASFLRALHLAADDPKRASFRVLTLDEFNALTSAEQVEYLRLAMETRNELNRLIDASLRGSQEI
jgi:hypothetical protein